MAYTPITVTLNPPLIDDDALTFDTKAFQYVQDQVALAGQINTTASDTNDNANSASASASQSADSAELSEEWATATSVVSGGLKGARGYAEDAEESASLAAGSANFRGEWSSLSGALSVPSSVLHNGSYWQLLADLPNVAASEPGVSGDWYNINASVFWSPISTSQTLDSRSYYAVDFTSGPLTLTLPASPAKNDFVQWYKSDGDSFESVIDRNGETIMGIDENLTIDFEATSLHLVYNGSDWRVVR